MGKPIKLIGSQHHETRTVRDTGKPCSIAVRGSRARDRMGADIGRLLWLWRGKEHRWAWRPLHQHSSLDLQCNIRVESMMPRSQTEIAYGIFWPEGQNRETHAVHGRLEIDPDDRTTLDLFTYTTGKGDPKQWIVDPDAAGEQLRILGETTIGRKWLFINTRRVGGYMDHLDGLPSPEPRVIGSIYASEHAITWGTLRDTLPNDVRGVEVQIDSLNTWLLPLTTLQKVTRVGDSIQLTADKLPKRQATSISGCDIMLEHDKGLEINFLSSGNIALAQDPVIRIRFDTAVEWQRVEAIVGSLSAFFRIALWHPVQIRKLLTVDPQPDGSISFTHLPWPGPQHLIPDPVGLPNDPTRSDINHYRALFREVDLQKSDSANNFDRTMRRWFQCYEKAQASIELLLLGAFRPDNRPEDTILYLVRSLERIASDLTLSKKGNLQGKLTDLTKRYRAAFKGKAEREHLINSAVDTRDWYTHRHLHENRAKHALSKRTPEELNRLNDDLLTLLKMILMEQISADRDFAVQVALRHLQR